MNEPIQKFDWKSSSYERPNETWVCGRTCTGETCRLGPSADGECQIVSQCTPEKKGEKYVCSRTVLNGGRCKEGPDAAGNCCQPDTSCQPVRSRLARRRLYTFAAAGGAGIIGLIITVLWPDRGMMAPGAVAAAHAGFENNCAACHAAADGRWLSPTHPELHSHLQDSAKCLECHTDLGPSPFNAHSQETGALAEITNSALEETGGTPVSISIASMLRDSSDQLACLSCHREHQGREFDMKQMADKKCQVCHKAQFADFNHGHPELEDFPYGDRVQIYFDHSRHLNLYFDQEEFRRLMPDGVSPGSGAGSCTVCHVTDDRGGTMLTRGFEDACSQCHEQNIVDNGFSGIPMLALSRLGPSPAAQQVTWPSSDDQFRVAPPFMRMLLGSDVAALDSGAQAEAVTQLFEQLSEDPEQLLADRLGKSKPALVRSLASIAPSVAQAADNWLAESRRMVAAAKRDADKDIQRSAAQEADGGSAQPMPEGPSPADSGPVTIDQDPRIRDHRGWYTLNSDLSIRYRPAAHQDPVLRNLIDYLVAQGGNESDDDNVVQLFELLANPSGSGTLGTRGPYSTGRCLSCHTVVADDKTGRRFVNWTAKRRRPPSLTHFRHSPHLNHSTDNCMSCHKVTGPLDEELLSLLNPRQAAQVRESAGEFDVASYLQSEGGQETLKLTSSQRASIDEAFAKAKHSSDFFRPEFFNRDSDFRWQPKWDPDCPVSSGLEPLDRVGCAKCHNPAGVSQSCLECHNYHIHSKR